MRDSSSREFHWYEGLALLLSCIGMQLITEYMTQWGTYFYSPPAGTGGMIYVAIGLAGTMFVVTYLVAAFSDPIVAMWSDKTNPTPGRWRLIKIPGRRRPFIFWGSIGVTLTGILFWYPLFPRETFGNFMYGTAILCIHWGVFCALITAPFNALGPELARSDRARVSIGNWIAAGMIIGLAIAEIAPGILVKALDTGTPHAAVQSAQAAERTMTDAFEEEDTIDASPVGFQRTAILFAVVALVFFQICVWVVRERYQSSGQAVYAPPLRVIKDTLGNRVFLKYILIFFLFNLGYLAMQRILPYWVRVGLNGSTDMVSKLMIPYIVFALLALVFTDLLSRWLPIKWMIFISLAIITTGLPTMYFIAIAPFTTTAKMVLAATLFAYCGIGQGMQYVLLTPMIGQIIDLDEMKSGERREAIYQSVSGLAWKGSQALSVYVATLSMNFFGNSAEHPLGIYLVGPIAGFFGVLALAVCWTYPVITLPRPSVPAEAEKEAV